ncbi:MAG: hypothetical protein HKO65_10245 [Gemmatimonadetes bacterium]|nr:hypothetical protein [Gemmatimonadota bacterium]NNM05472.1 hypothetical protein [Gemmatimonadota bacterium]
MPIHDAYARVTPYELLLPTEGFADERFPLIQQEAKEREADLFDPERFALLSEAGAILREIRGEGDDPQLIHQFGILLFHAFHFWKEGLPFFQLETGAVRYLVKAGPEGGGWAASLPGLAGYVQLPQHLMWVPGGEGVQPESVDGFFWSAPESDGLSVLIVMGIRKDRPGLSVVPLPTLPLSAAGEWAGMTVRPDGNDFGSSVPGAELENLYALEAGAEAIKLAMRVFWYLDTFPASVARGNPAPEGSDGPVPSRLAARRIVAGGE